ncbi:predicted protein [Sclerotinia sclerotiorum 1980 UF-70]|uniref:Uncharacterized protein n=2 Tax=Sclerotinia sclerotiorum (strain ATCC 18683 / 1980 / Ss-1) TaxID=665079 RepID=A7EWQ8_SCLS1|nr:predicted protein [Sclerotinia sclerotiorum 1980 UF-70]APA05356.1 hypothetical protein sscle_01g001260 [Sclerotinia sclerotiorum 1980 UF-70]EDN93900.1 predicted protein [Sclerotinia sclerotiorum 1980 UF-70]
MQFVQIRPLSFGQIRLTNHVLERSNVADVLYREKAPVPPHNGSMLVRGSSIASNPSNLQPGHAPINRMIHLPKVLYTNPFESPGVVDDIIHEDIFNLSVLRKRRLMMDVLPDSMGPHVPTLTIMKLE